MNIKKIESESIEDIARFMADIKSEWWDYEGALKQLKSGIGWYIEDDKPLGWIFCKDLRGYKTLEIECLGYNKNGEYKIGEELTVLVEKCEKWANGRNYKNIRFIIGSRGMSCHKRSLGKIWEELKDIKPIDRKEYEWFIEMGFEPHGLLPDIYDKNYHGIILIKKI